jgi:hypothetical protein
MRMDVEQVNFPRKQFLNLHANSGSESCVDRLPRSRIPEVQTLSSMNPIRRTSGPMTIEHTSVPPWPSSLAGNAPAESSPVRWISEDQFHALAFRFHFFLKTMKCLKSFRDAFSTCPEPQRECGLPHSYLALGVDTEAAAGPIELQVFLANQRFEQLIAPRRALCAR